MNEQYLTKISEECKKILKEVANVTVKIGDVHVNKSPYISQNVVVTVGFTGDAKGQLSLAMSEKSALIIAGGMMGGMQLEILDEYSKSAICELSNIMFGNVATVLFNEGLTVNITPPIVMVGNEIKVSVGKLQVISIPLLMNDVNIISIDIVVMSDD